MVAVGRSRERRYDCQNWRADVSAILTDEGSMVEWVKYSAYGVPFGLPAGDTDSDGDYDTDDKTRITSGTYDVRKDVNLDGVADADDITQANAVTGGNHALGRGVLSAGGPGGAVGNRRGYAGYEYAPELEGTGAAGRHLYHVRFRVYDADVGRWTRRDPLGYVDGMGLYEYVRSIPVNNVDPFGLTYDPWVLALIVHYFYGRGGLFILPASAYSNLPGVVKAKNTIRNKVLAKAHKFGKSLLERLNCECDGVGPREFGLWMSFPSMSENIPSGGGRAPSPLKPSPDLEWAIGGHFLYANVTCQYTVRCGGIYPIDRPPYVAYTDREYYWFSCNMRFHGEDYFAEPLGNWFEPSWIINILGQRYHGGPFWIITESWTESLWGVGFGKRVPLCGGAH